MATGVPIDVERHVLRIAKWKVSNIPVYKAIGLSDDVSKHSKNIPAKINVQIRWNAVTLVRMYALKPALGSVRFVHQRRTHVATGNS